MVRLYRRKVALLGLLSAFLLVQQALAAVFIIADGDVAGLKAAINTANSNNEGDTILLATNGHYTLTAVDNTSHGPSGLPVIINDNQHALVISGNGATISRDPNAPAFRIFTTFSAIGDLTFDVSLDSVTLSNGLGATSGSENTLGGGIFNSGVTLTLTNCTISGSFSGSGGAISNQDGIVSMTGCTVSGNSAVEGGAIYNRSPFDSSRGATVHVKNCTFSGNTISGNAGSIISNDNSFNTFADSRLDLTGCTLNGGNTNGAYGIYDQANQGHTQIVLANCILKNCPVHHDSFSGGNGDIFSSGYNLSSDDGNGRLNQTGDQINTDPGLDPAGLQSNGGPTKTIALVAGSAAIDAGKAFGLTTDQRGTARPYDNPSIGNAAGGDGSDIGAYEAPQDLRQSGNPSYVVTTLADSYPSECTVNDCTLREAINANEAAGGGRTITFAQNLTGTLHLAAGVYDTLQISTSVNIQGPGARVIAVSGNDPNSSNPNVRVFYIYGQNKNVTISGLTLRDGLARVAAENIPSDANCGGAIWSSVNLTVNDCTFTENVAAGPAGSGDGAHGYQANGGAIFNSQGTLTLNRCSFLHNSVTGGAGAASTTQFGRGGNGGDASGSAVFNLALTQPATLNVTNCTFYNNVATGGAGGDGTFGGQGGWASGTILDNYGLMGLTADTIAANNGTGGTGGHGSPSINNGSAGAAWGGVVEIQNNNAAVSTVSDTIIAANNAVGAGVVYDVSGSFISSGYNLIGSADASSGFNNTGDQTGTNASRINPMLGAAQNNGGPTDTMALLTGSSAIDAGKAFGLTIDQRGFPRPLNDPAVSDASGGDGSDIGAFERDPPQVFATLTVNTAADHDDGVCSQLDCTLREAINAANSLAGDNVITFAPAVTGVIQLTSALPNVSTNVAIQGPGARVLAVSGNNAYRPFFFTGGSSSISGLTIRDGHVTGGLSGSVQGGGIYNQATLSLSQCTVKNNVAQGGFAFTGAGDGGSGSGGGLYNVGVLTLDRCTFSGNAAGGGKGGDASRALIAGRGGAANGGALCNDAGGNLTLSECTFSANTGTGGNGGNGGATGGNGGAGNGGIYTNGTITLTSCTVSGNTGMGGTGGTGTTNGLNGTASGGVRNGGTATIRNTISAANTPSDVNGAFTSQGYNLIGPLGSATGFTATGDQTGVNDPRLSVLQNNGGSTDTMVPLVATPASGAIDKGNRFALTYDQRNQLRTLDSPFFSNAAGGDGTDIGAVEFSPMTGTDSDGDGMSDDFELFYGFNPSDPSDGARDSDGDGLTNAQECQAGTNPLDPNSNLRIVAVARTGNDFSVTFSLAVADKTYRLERKDGATDATWNSINGVSDLTPTFSGSGQITDPGGASTTKRFYRVRVLP